MYLQWRRANYLLSRFSEETSQLPMELQFATTFTSLIFAAPTSSHSITCARVDHQKRSTWAMVRVTRSWKWWKRRGVLLGVKSKPELSRLERVIHLVWSRMRVRQERYSVGNQS